MAISHILPKQTSKGLNLGGKGLHVVYLDLDYKFDIFRVSNLVQGRIEDLIRPKTSEENTVDRSKEVLGIVTEALEKLHVFSCKSSVQLAATLRMLASDFLPQLYNDGESLGVIILDNIASYWDALRELKQGSQSYRGQDQMTRSSFLTAAIRNLSEIQNLCEIPIIISRRLRGNEEFSLEQNDINRHWKDFTTKSVHLEKLGKPTTAKSQANIGYRMRWVKPDIQYEINYLIQSSSGIGIRT